MVLLASIVGLAACEALLRATGHVRRLAETEQEAWPWVMYDPILGRANRPEFVSQLGFRINELGFRGPEIEEPKPAGVPRVVCLGDSTTFGIWRESRAVTRGDISYPEEAERILRDRGLRFQVVNAGVLGYTSANGLRQLVARVLPLDPDVVTIRLGNNDHTLAYTGAAPALLSPAAIAFMQVAPSLLRFDVVRLAFHAQQTVFHEAPAAGSMKVSREAFASNLRTMVGLIRSAGAQALFLDFPLRELSLGPPPDLRLPNYHSPARTFAELHAIHASYQSVMEQVASELAVPVVRAADRLREADPPAFPAWDNSHPNEHGIRIIAEALADALETRSGFSE